MNDTPNVYPPELFYHPYSGFWWNSRLRRYFAQDGSPVEIVECAPFPEPTDSVLDRIHLDWHIAAALERHGARRCQTCMEELILESI